MPADAAIADLFIFWLVVAGRFLLPLLIPRFPLPAILISLCWTASIRPSSRPSPTSDLSGYQG